MASNYRFNDDGLKKLSEAQVKALKKTGQAVLTDLVQKQKMPFDTGEMQNNRTFVDDSNVSSGEIIIKTIAPQARRLYYHPEYNFQQGKNANAGGRWFDDYLPNGAEGDLPTKIYAELVRREIT
ncbi:MAG: hypothetical protein K5643_05275 [Saccharofermentans sp.]|jgi:hypothetical protein|nr:hypothetical protein [Saccharofermentans sp.]